MNDLLREIRWLRVLIAAAGALVLSWVIVFLIIFGYAAQLGFEAQGAPDQAAIQAFAERTGPLAGPIAGIVTTILAAAWAARKTTLPRINGLAVGVVVAVIMLIMGGSPSFRTIIMLLVTAAAGWVGGLAGGKGKGSEPGDSPSAPLA